MYQAGELGYRLTTFFGGMGSNSNEFAMIVLMLIPIAAGLAKSYRKSNLLCGIAIICLLLFVYSLTRSFSRGAFLGLVAVVPVLAYFNRRSKAFLVLFVVAGMIVFFKTPGKYYDRMGSIFGEESYEDSGAVDSRLRLQQEALYLMKQHPLFGAGIGTFSYALRQHGIQETYGEAHNSYLGVAAETGVINGTIFVCLIFLALKELNEARGRWKGDPKLGEVPAHLICSLIGYCVSAFFLSQEYNRILFMLFAFATALKNQAPEQWAENGSGLAQDQESR
jgi:O-antigen ligase